MSSEEGRRQLHAANSGTCVVRWTYSKLFALGTDISWLLAQGCGTAFQLVLRKWTSVMTSSSGC